MESYPSQFGIDQVVDFVINNARIRATVRAIHFTASKVRYDLDLWLVGFDKSSTRIYNVDSCFVVEVCDARDDEGSGAA